MPRCLQRFQEADCGDLLSDAQLFSFPGGAVQKEFVDHGGSTRRSGISDGSHNGTAISQPGFWAAQPYCITRHCKFCHAVVACLALSRKLLKVVPSHGLALCCFPEVQWRKLMDLPGLDADNAERADGEGDWDEDESRPPRFISRGPRSDQVIIFAESGILAARSH